MSTRHSVQSAATSQASKDFASDVSYYLALQPRQLPSRYLYDALGSALFAAICELPWYRVTSAELALLEQRGREVFERAGAVTRIIELGPGNGSKLRTFIDHGRASLRPLELHLVDVSPAALGQATRVLETIDRVAIVTHEARYETGLVEATRPAAPGATLVMFLGSNIGNFDPPGAEAFLRTIRGVMKAGDTLMIGADLVKAERELLLAYDDPLQVTAAFNRNLLVRINRELGGDFHLDRFAHAARWNREQSRVEMHLVSLERQRVRIPAAEVDMIMEAGETIWTESSYKYEVDTLGDMLEGAGFRAVEHWVAEPERFALVLVEAA
jgi:dimethylhistidine N-methyltransferase